MLKLLRFDICGEPFDDYSLQIRVGENEDFSENQICWFILNLPAGHYTVFKGSEPLQGRSGLLLADRVL